LARTRCVSVAGIDWHAISTHVIVTSNGSVHALSVNFFLGLSGDDACRELPRAHDIWHQRLIAGKAICL
jgi:hypothetical protein